MTDHYITLTELEIEEIYTEGFHDCLEGAIDLIENSTSLQEVKQWAEVSKVKLKEDKSESAPRFSGRF